MMEPDIFETHTVTEQTPFKNPAVGELFDKWCRINDSLVPTVVNREYFDNRGIKGILEKLPDGKQKLFIPEDLQPWEMVAFMEVVDTNTYFDKPEKQTEKRNEMILLGKKFSNAGIYIASRIDPESEGKEIAEALAETFYNYGQKLRSTDPSSGIDPLSHTTFEEISSKTLTPEETEEIDKMLSGKNLYESRLEKVKSKLEDPENTKSEEELREEERKHTLSQFFRASKKAYELSKKDKTNEQKQKKSFDWWLPQNSVHSEFLNKVQANLQGMLETPKREFDMTISRRGMEILTQEMNEPGWRHKANEVLKKAGIDIQLEEKKLRESLNVELMKAELNEVRKGGNTEKIVSKENEIADKIQAEVGKFVYQENSYSPTQMLNNRILNCVGAMELAGGFYDEVGINYVVADVEEHTTLLTITSDGNVQWREPTNSTTKHTLTNDMFKNKNTDNIRQIAELNSQPNHDFLNLDLNDESYDKLVGTNKHYRYVRIYKPQVGIYIELSFQNAVNLRKNGLYKAAAAACRNVLSADPNFPEAFAELGKTLLALKENDKALKCFQRALIIDPNNYSVYYDIGTMFASQPDKKHEASSAFSMYIEKADKEKDAELIEKAQKARLELSHIEPLHVRLANGNPSQ